jgi:hypothetical protein
LAESAAGLLSGVDVIDLGPRRLRDLPTPVQVFQVQADGLRTDFPPLRALDVSPGNLRPALTSFIGRESAILGIAPHHDCAVPQIPPVSSIKRSMRKSRSGFDRCAADENGMEDEPVNLIVADAIAQGIPHRLATRRR